MNEQTAEALDALFVSNSLQTARIEALEITLAALISTLTSFNPTLSKHLPEMLKALANIRAAQLGDNESTVVAFNEQIAKQQGMIQFVTAK